MFRRGDVGIIGCVKKHVVRGCGVACVERKWGFLLIFQALIPI